MAILAIVTSIAVGGYRQYVRRAAASMRRARCCGSPRPRKSSTRRTASYAADAEMADAPPAGLGIDGTERGYYSLAIALAGRWRGRRIHGDRDGRRRVDQADDEDCWVFGINERGLRTAAEPERRHGTGGHRPLLEIGRPRQSRVARRPRRSRISPSNSTSATPQVMAESATLNAGYDQSR